MINQIDRASQNSLQSPSFTHHDGGKKKKYVKDTLLKNTMTNNVRIALDKFSNAATIYTAKGLTGNKNSNFYEFLTLGSIPYVVGSLMLMSIFNSANKHFDNFSKTKASQYGSKMALGVLFYGIAKELAKPLVTAPVKMTTGVDVNLPYARVIYELPDYKDDTDITSIEYHKVFESVEFPRWDLLYADEAHGRPRNEYFDKVAKKMGLGGNLKDSDQEVKPRIKEIVAKTNSVRNLVSYLWAAVGVGVAVQAPWDNFFTNRPKFSQMNFKESSRVLLNSFKDSVKEFYHGKAGSKGFSKHAGKALFFTALLATILGDMKIITGTKKPSSTDASDVIDKSRKYIVN